MEDKAVFVDLESPEQKEKINRLCSMIVDLLRKETTSPIEAYAVVVFVKNGFEETYGIHSSIVYGKDGVGHA